MSTLQGVAENMSTTYSYVTEALTNNMTAGLTTSTDSYIGDSTPMDDDAIATTEDYMYEYMQYKIHVYPGFSFERPVYLFIWEILVVLTSLVNVVVIIVLLRKNMRSATNMLLVAIAVSDSMTGLVTLPSYIAVYQKFEPAMEYSDNNLSTSNLSTTPVSSYNYDDYTSNNSYNANDYSDTPQEGYGLDKSLCEYFMLSKFFVSKIFHTYSIWLTLFLGIQRFISVAVPFKVNTWLSSRNIVIVCVCIAVGSPLLHIYHLFDLKAKGGWCQWDIPDKEIGGLAYLWITFFFMHCIPCLALVIFTTLFVIMLWKGSSKIEHMGSGKNAAFQKRTDENRRISIVVIAIVIVFLVPEIPYGVFLLYSAILKSSKQKLLDLKINRAIHVTYEISLVLSFHANFYIYTVLNRRFRSTMKRLLLTPVNLLRGRETRFSVSRTSSFGSTRGKTPQTSCSRTMATEMKAFNPASSEKNSAANSNSVCEPEHETSKFIVPSTAENSVNS